AAAELLSEAFFRTQTDDSVHRVGCAMGSGVEVAHLKLSEQTDAHDLNAGENEDTGDDEERAVKRHDVLAGHDLENKQPGSHACTCKHPECADGAEEVQGAGHVP